MNMNKTFQLLKFRIINKIYVVFTTICNFYTISKWLSLIWPINLQKIETRNRRLTVIPKKNCELLHISYRWHLDVKNFHLSTSLITRKVSCFISIVYCLHMSAGCAVLALSAAPTLQTKQIIEINSAEMC